jgi:transposase
MCQYDWGQTKLIVNGIKRKVFFAVFALPYSHYRFLKVTKSMDGKAFVDAFISFVEHMNGIFPVLLIDIMKMARKNLSFWNKVQETTTLF